MARRCSNTGKNYFPGVSTSRPSRAGAGGGGAKTTRFAARTTASHDSRPNPESPTATQVSFPRRGRRESEEFSRLNDMTQGRASARARAHEALMGRLEVGGEAEEAGITPARARLLGVYPSDDASYPDQIKLIRDARRRWEHYLCAQLRMVSHRTFLVFVSCVSPSSGSLHRRVSSWSTRSSRTCQRAPGGTHTHTRGEERGRERDRNNSIIKFVNNYLE